MKVKKGITRREGRGEAHKNSKEANAKRELIGNPYGQEASSGGLANKVASIGLL